MLQVEELFHLEEEGRGLISPEQEQHDPLVWSELDEKLSEQLLEEEIKKLSLTEHENILFDVHGIAQVDQDDPADLEMRLDQMELEIGKIRRKHAYERAKYWDDGYVQDRKFRLRFLRCDRFHSQVAAQRIVRHFQIKLELFGDGPVLARDVMMSDLAPQDLIALYSGCFQVLPTRDAGGRCIYSVAPKYRPNTCTIEDCARAKWYVMNSSMIDEETQRKGVVGVVSNFGKDAQSEPIAFVRRLERIRSGIPTKLTGVHYCYDDKSHKSFVQSLPLFLAKSIRTRFRSHFGTRENIIFELQTYGIPMEFHPILATQGELSLEWHKEWLQIRRTQEEATESRSDGTENVILPRRFDVLFGRGKYTREHMGNLHVLHLVEMHYSEYDRAGKLEKTVIANRIVDIVHESLGRFLKWEKLRWVEVDDSVAREKVSHAFRHLRSKAPAPKVDSLAESSTKPKPASSLSKRPRGSISTDQ